MGKGLKITFKVLGWTLVAILLLLLAAMVTIQSPKVQSYLGKKVVGMLQDRMDADISFSQVSFKPFETLVLKDVLVTDPAALDSRADTVLVVNHLSVKFSIRGLFYNEGVHVSRLLLQGGAFNLAIEPEEGIPDESTTNIQRIFRIQSGDEEQTDLGNLFDAREVTVKDFRFRMFYLTGEPEEVEPGVIDWNNLDVLLAEAEARNIRYSHNIITGTVERLRAEEMDTGLVLEQASAKVKVGNQSVRLENLELVEKDTHLMAKYFQMDGPLDDYSDFINRIRIEAEVQKGSLVSMKTIGHFAPLEGITFRGYLQGKYKGTVSRFNLQDIAIEDPDSGLRAVVQGGMTGLPDTDNCQMQFQVEGLTFDMPGLATFVKSWSEDTDLDLSGIGKGQEYTFSGTVTGLLDRMQVDGTAFAGSGEARVDLLLRNAVNHQEDLGLDGLVQTRNLDLGRILGIDALGEVTLSTRVKSTLASGGPQLQVDTLQVSRLNLLDYDYTGISGSGYYRKGAFDGRIVASDPNLNLLFQGIGRPTGNEKTDYQFYANLGYADLNALNLDKRGLSRASFEAESSLTLSGKNNLDGQLTIRSLNLENSAGQHDLGPVVLTAKATEHSHRLDMSSEFLGGSYSGGKSVLDFVKDLQNLVLDAELPALTADEAEPWDGTTYEVNLTVRDARNLLDFVLPGAYIENNTRLNLSVDRSGLLNTHLISGRLAYYDKYLRDVNLTLDNANSSVQADLVSPSLYLSGLELRGNRLTLFANNNHLGAAYSFDNETDAETRAELVLGADLSRDAEGLAVQAQVLPSNIYFEGEGWGISSEEILYHNGEWKVNRLFAVYEDETLLVDGGFSPTRADTLTVSMEKFDLALLNTLTGGVPQIEGRATGNALVISPSSPAVGLLAAITCDSTLVSGKRLGKLDIASVWNEDQNRFDLTAGNNLDGKKTVGIEGYLKPSSSELDARASLDGLDLEYVAPILSSAFSVFQGALSGAVRLSGKLDNLQLSSEGLHVEEGLLALDYTQVPYQVEGTLSVDNNGFHFNRMRARDAEGGTGSIGGSVLMKDFSQLGYDIHVRMNRLKALALKQGMNPLMFGDVYATGTVDVTGWSPNMQINVDASTVKEGNFHLLINSTGSSRSTDILTFVEPVVDEVLDPYEQLLSNSSKTLESKGNFGIRLNIRPSQDVMVYLDLSDENSLKASGTGQIELDSQSASNTLTLNGNYELKQGSFHFSALNLVSRDFTIQDGSSVHFNGDLWDTDLNVNGQYTTKASLANLIADENAVNRRSVICGISITDKLRNPQVQFSIDIPDLNPEARAQVDAALNTEDKVQKQFLYLLIAGSFLPSEESGITTDGSEMLFSNVSGIMAGQLNNIFQKLNIPLDLGLNYQATNAGTNIFDVALSTQLFNNRVLVNGSVGNKQIYGTTTSEVAGNIDIEIKLNKSGTLRANLFSHSADQLTAYLDNSQRSGAGLAYQREFNNFLQFLRELFHPRRTQADAPPREDRPREGGPREGSPREEGSREGRPREGGPREGGTPPTRQVVLQVDSTGHVTPIHELR